MTPKNKFYVRKEYFSFSKTKIKRCRYYKSWEKKNKENLNSSESNQQTSTASTQITTTKILLRVFPHKRNQVINVLLKLIPKSKIYSKLFLSWSAYMNSIHFINVKVCRFKELSITKR